ncbi:hypothetical protein RF11_15860 [Thelohanellus kitauei]|uniref:Uncharacterized protein n=1 Tax=Thelohanellus kitauei TaxID=669202 RepID=A0A0C2MSL4_THEKT|nr:hypothetical protein RF11_15860 [Thelohanellus kitauei]
MESCITKNPTRVTPIVNINTTVPDGYFRKWYNLDEEDQKSRSHVFTPYTIHYKCQNMLPSFVDCIQGDVEECYVRYPGSNIVPQLTEGQSRFYLLGKRRQTNDFGSPPNKQARFEQVYAGQESDNDSIMEVETTNPQSLDLKPILPLQKSSMCEIIPIYSWSEPHEQKQMQVNINIIQDLDLQKFSQVNAKVQYFGLNRNNYNLQYIYWEKSTHSFVFLFNKKYKIPWILKQIIYVRDNKRLKWDAWRPMVNNKRLHIDKLVAIKHLLFGISYVNQTFFYVDQQLNVFSAHRFERSYLFEPSDFDPSFIYKLVKINYRVSQFLFYISSDHLPKN